MKIRSSWQRLPIRTKLLTIVVAVQIPMILAFGLITGIAKEQINTQLFESYQQVLSTYKSALISDFSSADALLSEMYTWEEAPEPYWQEVEAFLWGNSFLSGIYAYDRETGVCINEVSRSNLASESQVAAHAMATSWNTTTGWRLEQANNGEDSYFVRTIVGKNAGFCIIVNLQMMSSAAQSRYNMVSPVVFEKNGRALTTAYWYQSGQIMQKEKNGYITLKTDSSRYMMVEDLFLTMTLRYAVPYHYNWNWLNYAIMITSMLTVLCFCLAWVVLQESIFQPLQRLLRVMEVVSEEDVQARAEGFKMPEFVAIGSTFNTMLDKLNQLKIESYEKQITVNQTKMNALRLQIRRHFFLNCLKSLYSLTLSGDLENMQEMILKLSVYLRYTLDIEKNLVALEKELQMCENYIQLQGIGQPNKPILVLDVDSKAMDCRIPPISILTLLENCCKYGITPGMALKISITGRCRKLDLQEYLSIILQDNGPGFTEETLETLNTDPDSLMQGGHVGLVNVLRRLKLIYGDNCSMWFSNQNGARIEITIPMNGESQ